MRLLAFAFVLLLACVSAFAVSLPDLRQLLADGKYGETVVKADAMLADRTVPAKEYFEIMMIKGEAAFHAQQKNLAVASFRAATRLANDRAEAILAASNAILAQRVNNGVLNIGNQKMEVMSADDRKQAMQKLADDILANQARQVQTALDARTLDPILAVLPDVYRMYVLEMQATNGNSTTAEPLARKLGTQAYDLIADELRRLQREISNAEQGGYAMSDWSGWAFRGITPAQRTDLSDRTAYINRIRNAILEIRRLAATLRVNTSPWDNLVSECDDLQDQISMVLNRNF